MDSFSLRIGKRLKLARASHSQEELAKALDLKDRQSVSAIETGDRRMTPEELIKAADFLEKPLSFFTDPYVVAEKNAFSYRAKTLDGKGLSEFAGQAERLISALRRFRDVLGETPSPVHSQLRDITKSTSFNAAAISGEHTAANWNLGNVPASRLRELAEEKLGISILFVDSHSSVSGAACRLDDGDVVLINRQEPEGRRNFNIAHEIFHLLTWEAMPPGPFELENTSSKKPRCEQLADSYAGGLLMPSSTIKERWTSRANQNFSDWLNMHAADLLVSRTALYWRLVNLGLIVKEEHPCPTSMTASAERARAKTPQLYNRAFVSRLQQVLSRGHLTVLRATEVLDCSIEQLVQLLKSYDLEVPFGY